MENEVQLVEQLNKTTNELRDWQKRGDEEREKRGVELGETRAKVEQIIADVQKIDATLTEVRKLAAAPRTEKGEVRTPEMEARGKAYDQFCRRGFDDLSVEHRASLSQASDAEGGFFAPIEHETTIIANAYNEAAIRPLCDVRPTGRSQVVGPIMKKASVAWGTELLAVSAQDLSAGANTLNIFNLKALVTISNDTLDDAEADVVGELNMMFSDALAEAEDEAFAAGAAQNKPEGFITNTTIQAAYKASGVAAAISDASNNGMDVLLQALFALKSTYRRNATWAMNSTTMGVLMQLKDGQGRYYWQPTTAMGVASTLHGKPYIAAEGMPDIAAGVYPIVVGDFRRGYKIRDRAGISIQRLSERYAEYDQTGFVVKKRVGGQVRLPEAFVPIKIAAS